MSNTETEIAQIGEFGLIKRLTEGIATHNPSTIKGVGDDMFAPDERVTAEQFATMVLRAGNYGEFDWQQALDILIQNGLLAEEDTADMDFFTRGDMAKIIYEAREKGLF